VPNLAGWAHRAATATVVETASAPPDS